MCGVGMLCVAIRTHSLSIPRLIDIRLGQQLDTEGFKLSVIRHGQKPDTEGFKLSVTHAVSANQNNTQREETEK